MEYTIEREGYEEGTQMVRDMIAGISELLYHKDPDYGRSGTGGKKWTKEKEK